MTPEELMDQSGGYWGEHPAYLVSDWKWAVENNDVRAGYWHWVLAQIEENA